jgi:ABC-type lipoprotein release transport system permease subunit
MAGCTLIIFMRSLQNGGYAQMIEDSVAPQTGHIQVHEKGFWKNRTLEYAFINEKGLLNKIAAVDSVESIAPRIYAGGLIIFKDTTAGSEIIAVDPEYEKNITTLHNYIQPGGRYLESGDTHSIVLGNNLAVNLGVNTGDTVSILSQGFDGSIVAENFNVKGVFRSPNAEYNRGLALIPFMQGVETFSMGEYISSYAIRVNDIDSVPETVLSIRKSAGEELEVMSWNELMPEIMQFISMDRVSSHIYVFMLYTIVAFGILNTIQMSVFERIRELGVMLSIGTSPGRIFSMVITESFIITVIGIIAGLVSGEALSYYFTIYPIDFSEYQAEMELYGMSTLMYYARLKAYDFIVTGALTLILSMIFTFFPARRASKLSPVRAIRHL